MAKCKNDLEYLISLWYNNQ